MKKGIALLLSALLVFSLAACGGGKPNDDPLKRPGTSGSDSTHSGGNTESPGDGTNTIIPGSTDVIYGKLDAAQKQAMIDQAKEEGVTVTFGADGSTTIKDKDGTVMVQNPDGTWTYQNEGGGEGQLGGDWPDNEYTKQIPKPDIPFSVAGVENGSFTAVFSGATVEQIRAYTDKVKAVGFTVDAEIEDQEMEGMVIYMYSASNASGYNIKIFSASGTSGLTISK